MEQPVSKKRKRVEPASFYEKRDDLKWNNKLTELKGSAFWSKLNVPGSGIFLKSFPRQQESFEYMDAFCRRDKAQIVSREVAPEDGNRRFLVCTFKAFWRRYWFHETPRDRHFYEIIRENCPCRLYFDIEFSKEANPGFGDGLTLLELFKEEVVLHLARVHGLSISSGDIVDLDSSTAEKFSRHLILPGVVFENNIHAGRFVAGMTADSRFWLSKKDGSKVFFADMGVYTRNRAFRLLYSSKFRKTAVLKIAEENAFPMSGLNEKQRFLLTLVHVGGFVELPVGCAVLKQPEVDIREPSSSSGGGGRCAESVKDFSPSPFPLLDDFVRECVLLGGGVKGGLRSWRHCGFAKDPSFPHPGYIFYVIANNRYCHRIKRFHKSNHVMMVADLAAGNVYQRCLDPECRALQFRGPLMPIPSPVMEAVRGEFLRQCQPTATAFTAISGGR